MDLLTVQLLGFLILPFFASCLTVPTLNAPSIFHHNVTVPSFGGLRINCYIQPPRPVRRLPSADTNDCYTALQSLLIGDKTMAPMHWSTDSGRGFHVPSAWGHGSCQILINNLRPHAEATFQTVLLAHLAAEVIEGCFYETAARLGGDVKVGNGADFEVMVAGTPVGQ